MSINVLWSLQYYNIYIYNMTHIVSLSIKLFIKPKCSRKVKIQKKNETRKTKIKNNVEKQRNLFYYFLIVIRCGAITLQT